MRFLTLGWIYYFEQHFSTKHEKDRLCYGRKYYGPWYMARNIALLDTYSHVSAYTGQKKGLRDQPKDLVLVGHARVGCYIFAVDRLSSFWPVSSLLPEILHYLSVIRNIRFLIFILNVYFTKWDNRIAHFYSIFLMQCGNYMNRSSI